MRWKRSTFIQKSSQFFHPRDLVPKKNSCYARIVRVYNKNSKFLI